MSQDPNAPWSQALLEATEGDKSGAEAAQSLLPVVYDELRRLAESYMRRERSDHTLQATELVHEAYARMVGSDRDWNGRTHFFAASAQAMRRLLIEHARQRASIKRGAGIRRVTLDTEFGKGGSQDFDLEIIIPLDEALTRLSEIDARSAQVVELRYFAGMSAQEAADHLGVSKRTVEGDWTYAKAWLKKELSAGA